MHGASIFRKKFKNYSYSYGAKKQRPESVEKILFQGSHFPQCGKLLVNLTLSRILPLFVHTFLPVFTHTPCLRYIL
jgi:hypothetical protein